MKALLPILLAASMASGCSVLEWKDRILTMAANTIPWSFEESMGDRLLENVLPADAVLDDPEANRQLKLLLSPLTRNTGNVKIKIHISKDPVLNAFAAPGGHLIFNRGMLLAADTPEEIAGVAAHELAHATERHVMRSMIQGISIYAVITLFFGDVNGLAAYLLAQGSNLLQNSFSRSQERQADEKGVASLLEARINPKGMIHFFEKIQKKSGESRVEAFLSTHPITRERIEAVEAALAGLTEQERKQLKPIDFNLQAFQARLR